MNKDAIFTMKLEPQLRSDFIAETQALHRPASQVMRDLMREFVERQRNERAYEQFLQQKVDLSRASLKKGLGRTDEEVSRTFSALKKQVRDSL